MRFSIRFGFSELQFTDFIQGLIFIVAAVYVLMSLAKVRRTGQAAHLKWLVPLAIYTINQSITYAIYNVYLLFNVAEPDAVNAITDIMDDASLLAFLWALIVLWQIIRTTPGSLKTPWLDQAETPEGVWPPVPKM